MEYLAYVGGALLGVQLMPQIRKVLVTQSVNDISVSYLILNIIGLSCIVSYAVYQHDPPIYIPACISATNTTMLLSLVLFFRYKNKVIDINSQG